MTVKQEVWDALTEDCRYGFENPESEAPASLYSDKVAESLASDKQLCSAFTQAKNDWGTYAMRGRKYDAETASQSHDYAMLAIDEHMSRTPNDHECAEALKAETARLKEYRDLATWFNPTLPEDLTKLMLLTSKKTTAEINFMAANEFKTDLPSELQSVWNRDSWQLRLHARSYEQFAIHDSVTVADPEIEHWVGNWGTYQLVKEHSKNSRCLTSLDDKIESPTKGELEEEETKSFAESYKRAKVLMGLLGKVGRTLHEANVAKLPSKKREPYKLNCTNDD